MVVEAVVDGEVGVLAAESAGFGVARGDERGEEDEERKRV